MKGMSMDAVVLLLLGDWAAAVILVRIVASSNWFVANGPVAPRPCTREAVVMSVKGPR